MGKNEYFCIAGIEKDRIENFDKKTRETKSQIVGFFVRCKNLRTEGTFLRNLQAKSVVPTNYPKFNYVPLSTNNELLFVFENSNFCHAQF